MNADPIARWYRVFEYAALGRSLEKRRFAFLDTVSDAKTALVLGDGDGRFLHRLITRNPQMYIDAVDSSAAMLSLARRRIEGRPHRAVLRHADALTVAFPRSDYDLIVTHFFLDCFKQSDCERLIARIAQRAAPQSCWLISEFREPASGPARYWARLWIGICYLFFRLTTGLAVSRLPDYAPALERCGYRLERQQISGTGILVSELWRRVC